MNILLHGAINASNFGDCLFADLFYNRLREAFPEDNIWFYDVKPYGISDYLRGQLGYNYIMNRDDYNRVDAFVYISGGFFGEDKKSIRDSVIRYKRYIRLGRKYVKKRIPVYIVGLEVGPIYYSFLRRRIKSIINSSRLLTVRNEESLNYCNNVLKCNNAILTSDTALHIKDIRNKASLNEYDGFFTDEQKVLFLHVPYNGTNNSTYVNKIVLPIIEFCENQKQYKVVFGMDNIEKGENFESIKRLFDAHEIRSLHYIYSSYWELCKLISKVDVVVTNKLHVGIVASSYGKAVISIPEHRHKTLRFYKNIGYEGNCISYYDITNEKMSELLYEKHNSKVVVKEKNIRESKMNLDLLIEDLMLIKEKREK